MICLLPAPPRSQARRPCSSPHHTDGVLSLRGPLTVCLPGTGILLTSTDLPFSSSHPRLSGIRPVDAPSGGQCTLSTAVLGSVAGVAVPSSWQGLGLSRTVGPPSDALTPQASLVFPTPGASPQRCIWVVLQPLRVPSAGALTDVAGQAQEELAWAGRRDVGSGVRTL